LGSIETWANTPEKVLASWRNKFVFAVEELDAALRGLSEAAATEDELAAQHAAAGTQQPGRRWRAHSGASGLCANPFCRQ
jgi:hypothetical protein